MHLYAVDMHKRCRDFYAIVYKNLTKIKKFAKNYCIIIPNVIQCEHPKNKTQQNQKTEKEKLK